MVLAIHSSGELSRGLEQNGYAGEERCSVISWDNLSPEDSGTVFVFAIICTVVLLELLSAGCRGQGIAGDWEAQ